MSDDPDSKNARDILDALGKTRRASGRRLVVPWWYDPLLGLALAGNAVHHAAPVPFNLFVVGACTLVIAFVLRDYMSRDVWVSGWRRGWTLPVSIGFLVFYLGLYGLIYWFYQVQGMGWALPAGALAVFAGTLLYSRLWMWVWRRETGGNA